MRAYVSAAMGVGSEVIKGVTPIEGGNRHWVYRLSLGERDVVARVSYGGDASEVAHAEHEAAVLAVVGGVAGPELYDFRVRSPWFDTPAMCMQFVPGRQAELATCGLPRIRELGGLVAWVHGRPVSGLGEASSVAVYADERLRGISAKLAWVRDPLPRALQERLRRAAGSVGEARFDAGGGLSLLHGDIGPGNVLWGGGPFLIDWEYARLGDPADEVAYAFDQNGLAPEQREAFWDGYGEAAGGGVRRLVERAAWWEPVTLLGSTLWWVERWVRRTEQPGDPGVPREAEFYLGHVCRRLDRLAHLV